MNPLVSVIIPTYNRAIYVVEAIESVLAQTYKDFEIIVVDDGSTDDTKKVLEPYMNRIVYIHQKNQKQAAARNTGIHRATGQYIAFLDSDDLWLPKKLEVQVDYMEAHPEIGMAHTGFLLQEESPSGTILKEWPYTKQWPSGNIFLELFLEPMVNTSTVLARRECFDAAGLFDPQLNWAEDYHMWWRIARNFPIGYIDKPLEIKRVHNTNLTKDRFEAKLGTVRALEKLINENPDIVNELGTCLIRRGRFNRYFALAYEMFDRGYNREARPYFARCIWIRPSYWLIYGYYLSCWIPLSWVKRLRYLKQSYTRVIKRLFKGLITTRGN